MAVGGFSLLFSLLKGLWNVTVRRYAENVAMLFPVCSFYLSRNFWYARSFHHWMYTVLPKGLLLQVAISNRLLFYPRCVLFCYSIVCCFVLLEKVNTSDKTIDHNLSRSMQKWSYGLAPVALSLTFAGFDWLSPDPNWYSTIFWGFIFLRGVILLFTLLLLF